MDSDDSTDFSEMEFSETMSVEEVSVWLERKGIPKKFCDAFRGKCP